MITQLFNLINLSRGGRVDEQHRGVTGKSVESDQKKTGRGPAGFCLF
jgi:hypothetical protein